MTRIAILADSGCQIELKQYENQGIYIVPLCITMKNHTYLLFRLCRTQVLVFQIYIQVLVE